MLFATIGLVMFLSAFSKVVGLKLNFYRYGVIGSQYFLIYWNSSFFVVLVRRVCEPSVWGIQLPPPVSWEMFLNCSGERRLLLRSLPLESPVVELLTCLVRAKVRLF